MRWQYTLSGKRIANKTKPAYYVTVLKDRQANKAAKIQRKKNRGNR